MEDLISGLHTFRNRATHHQRIWHEPLAKRYDDMPQGDDVGHQRKPEQALEPAN